MKYSPQDREEFSKQIKELLDLELIIPSKSPHMSPAFLVENEAEKRRGKKRVVVNYKEINNATIGDSHNLPCMQDLLTLPRGKTIFSSFDCKSGFWQVLLDEEPQLLTAFTCPNGHYQRRVVPFGLKQAPKQESERKKSEFIPCQTAKGKEKSSPLTPVALEKSKNKVNEELQASSSPEANGSGMKKAIKNFRKKIASARDANIFIKCTSTFLDWYQGRTFSSYHHLEVGIAKTRMTNSSKVKNDENQDPENWVNIRTRGFLKILSNLQKIKKDKFVKVNYYSNNCIITSYCGSPLNSQEMNLITRLKIRFFSTKWILFSPLKKVCVLLYQK
ncbi:hypothetical protein E3N88_19430 [Mikania micrantha]|uniref:Reverse transcriptase domain-containing protein n=1 Tax=Mikania micrantha TaxID=192012 RepID=A0A5N6NNM8_9ASTR|nr:hypothetical protein E3N88_19430 [Mikania micrantha]